MRFWLYQYSLSSLWERQLFASANDWTKPHPNPLLKGSIKEFMMQHKRPPLPVIILIILVIAAGIYYGVRTLNGNENGTLTASGTIESVVVNVSPQMAGKVKEVLVDEGKSVKKGDLILSLDDSLLAAQREVAQRGVDSAHQALLTAQSAFALSQAQYDAAL